MKYVLFQGALTMCFMALFAITKDFIFGFNAIVGLLFAIFLELIKLNERK